MDHHEPQSIPGFPFARRKKSSWYLRPGHSNANQIAAPTFLQCRASWDDRTTQDRPSKSKSCFFFRKNNNAMLTIPQSKNHVFYICAIAYHSQISIDFPDFPDFQLVWLALFWPHWIGYDLIALHAHSYGDFWGDIDQQVDVGDLLPPNKNTVL